MPREHELGHSECRASGVLNLRELEALARRVLSTAHGYYASGADDEHTLRDNELAFPRFAGRLRAPSCIRRRQTLLSDDVFSTL